MCRYQRTMSEVPVEVPRHPGVIADSVWKECRDTQMAQWRQTNPNPLSDNSPEHEKLKALYEKTKASGDCSDSDWNEMRRLDSYIRLHSPPSEPKDNLFLYIKRANRKLYDLISDMCFDRLFERAKNITFLQPNDEVVTELHILAHTGDPNRVAEILTAMLIPVYSPSLHHLHSITPGNYVKSYDESTLTILPNTKISLIQSSSCKWQNVAIYGMHSDSLLNFETGLSIYRK